MILKAILLAILVSWHTRTPSGKALQFGGAYAGVLILPGLLAMMAGGGLLPLAILTVLRFLVAAGYFWLLDRIHGVFGWILTLAGALALIIFL